MTTTKNSTTDERNEPIDERAMQIKDVLFYIRDGIRRHAHVFDEGVWQQALEVKARIQAEYGAVWLHSGQRAHHHDAEIAEMERREKGHPSAELLDKIETMIDRLNHSRYNEYQLGLMWQNLCQKGPGFSLVQYIDFLSVPGSAGYGREQAPVAVWTAVVSSIDPPRVAPPKIPATFNLPNDHPDKTDQEGRPWYIPMDHETGLPRVDFDRGSLSMTESAIHARRHKYAGPTKTAAEWENDIQRQERERQRATDESVRLKNEQRRRAHEHQDDLINRTNAAHDKIREDARTERERQEKQRQNMRKTGPQPPYEPIAAPEQRPPLVTLLEDNDTDKEDATP